MAERIHLIGIGGAGMAPLAQLYAAKGWEVSGSDARASATVAGLRDLGVTVGIGHRPEAVPADALVVVSSAIRPDNPELAVARRRGQRVVHRSRALAAIAEGQRFVAVAGAHGKTTTSGMLAHALREVGADPSFAIGATVLSLGASAHLGAGDAFVAEADESDGSFLAYTPQVAVVTNVEVDHLDHYGSPEALMRAYVDFVARIPAGGLLVACTDDPSAREVIAATTARVHGYGLEPSRSGAADAAPAPLERHWRITEVRTGSGEVSAVLDSGDRQQQLRLPVAGVHNLLNATAAWIAGVELGAEPTALAAALGTFAGTGRRFEHRGEAAGVRVIDDYAHHPTEVAATLATARTVAGDGRVVALFQPHLYSRTRDHAEGFARALAIADLTVVTGVYGAREQPMPGVDATLITEPMRREGADARHVADRTEAAEAVAQGVRPGDLVLTIGAGDVTELADVILQRLRERS